jgi:hypothetical protein
MLDLDAAYQTTVRVITDWRRQSLFARPRTPMERVLIVALPTLWACAVLVGAAAILS